MSRYEEQCNKAFEECHKRRRKAQGEYDEYTSKLKKKERIAIIGCVISAILIGVIVFANDLPICPVYDITYPECMQEFDNSCGCFDYDSDCDVDLRDFAIAQNNFYWR